MRFKITVAALACAGFAWLLAAPPAEAQQSGLTNRTTRVVTVARPRTRITVRRERSYLDPGREVIPYSQPYTDYVFLNRRPMDVLGPGQNLDRQPLTAPWELGGSWRIP